MNWQKCLWGFSNKRLSSLHHPLIITHNWNAELEFATKINSYLVMACPFSLHTLHFLMSINSVFFYIQFHAQTPTTLLQKKKTFILFWCFFTFVLKRKKISEWLVFWVYCLFGSPVRIDAIFESWVCGMEAAIFWYFFLAWAGVNVMVCGTGSKSELGFLSRNSLGICGSVWVGVKVVIWGKELESELQFLIWDF